MRALWSPTDGRVGLKVECCDTSLPKTQWLSPLLSLKCIVGTLRVS